MSRVTADALPAAAPSSPDGVTATNAGVTATNAGVTATDAGVTAANLTPAPQGDGRSRRWDTHRTTRRDELTRAARKAVHHGGPDLSMDEIAAAIGTSKSIVYRYFQDRSGLQQAVGEAVLTDLGAALAEASHHASTPHETIRAMVGVYLEMISTSPSVYAFVTRGGDLADATAPMRTLAADAAALLAPVLRDVLVRAGGDPALDHVWAAGVIGFVRGAAEVWLTEQAVAPMPDGGASPIPSSHPGAAHPAHPGAANVAHPGAANVAHPGAGHLATAGPLVVLGDALTDWICSGIQSP